MGVRADRPVQALICAWTALLGVELLAVQRLDGVLLARTNNNNINNSSSRSRSSSNNNNNNIIGPPLTSCPRSHLAPPARSGGNNSSDNDDDNNNRSFVCSLAFLIHFLVRALVHLLCSFKPMMPFAHSLTVHSPVHSQSIHLSTCPRTNAWRSSICPATHACPHIHQSIHLFIPPFIHSGIHSFVHPSIR